MLRHHTTAAAMAVLLLITPAAATSVSFTPLGDLPGGIFESEARGVSGDGAVVVGFSSTASGITAFRWTSGGGMQNLRDLLIACGATGLTGWTLTEALGISADGLTVAGYGTNPLGDTEAWIATVPEPSTVILAVPASRPMNPACTAGP